MNATLRRVLSVVTAFLLTGAGLLAVAPSASADVTYVPDGAWNGKVIYLSQACHDRGGDTCVTNTGCDGFSENANSYALAVSAAIGDDPDHLNLTRRGYRVVRGNGLTRENIANSNRVGADLHIPLHSNALNVSCDPDPAPSKYGTHGLYVSAAGRECAADLVSRVGASSPGDNDRLVYRTDLGELNQTNAVACYLEQEFHVWQRGVDWMRNRAAWSGLIGLGVDVYLGYP
ncbi:hypothetical protein [Myceligenerans pegani]|uniref:N-acetylmuramoyl-L-alanine amidase n=1 Tax=Myceligenerans pegani TaxID=2776917 RepID=A0ABR9N5N6_9MICO|nr:hypothetical protein [Myceligenerans sp. TRM 65318]MBE1878439.1 hypothetical protein [Myceligenerans sp. TRM 65318]MBE3020710.1 hypothetical protein [Myceligenerans sp. TRM 65318]